jgi:hypothetical protein
VVLCFTRCFVVAEVAPYVVLAPPYAAGAVRLGKQRLRVKVQPAACASFGVRSAVHVAPNN